MVAPVHQAVVTAALTNAAPKASALRATNIAALSPTASAAAIIACLSEEFILASAGLLSSAQARVSTSPYAIGHSNPQAAASA